MSLFQKIFSAFSSQPNTAPSTPANSNVGRASASFSEQPPRQMTNGTNSGNYYEALRDSPDRTPVPTYRTDWRSLIRALNRERLAFLGDYLYDNYGQVSYAVNITANYSVPIVPQAASPNPEWNKAADAWWSGLCKRIDFTGRFHMDTLQRIICKAIDNHGDVAVVPTVENGFPQIRVIETWRIGARRQQAEAKDVIDGVQLTPKGVVSGYWVDMSGVQNQLSAISTGPLDFVPASQMFLIYDPDRNASFRGLSPIRRGSNNIRDAKDIEGFEKTATKIGSALAAVVRTPTGTVEADVWGNDTGSDDGTVPGNEPPVDTPAAETKQEKRLSMAELLGGDIPILGDGEELQQLENKRPGTGVVDFIHYLVGSFVYGLDIPPAFFLDEKLTGPNQRAVNGKAQRKFNQRQHMLGALIEWLWPRFVGWAIANGELEPQEGFDKCEWQGPPQISIDEGKDAASDRDDNAVTLKTRQEIFAKRSLNWKREIDQGIAEDTYILGEVKKVADASGLPIEQLASRYGFGPPKPPPPADNNKQSDNNSKQ